MFFKSIQYKLVNMHIVPGAVLGAKVLKGSSMRDGQWSMNKSQKQENIHLW